MSKREGLKEEKDEMDLQFIIETLLCFFSELQQTGGARLHAGSLQLQTGDGGAGHGLQHHHRRRRRPADRN